jgi:hypothetical protein
VAEAAQRIRYNFGTTGGEISGERACKRRSAKHLEFLPSLLEGRRSIQLSYGRGADLDSRTLKGPLTLIWTLSLHDETDSLQRRHRRYLTNLSQSEAFLPEPFPLVTSMFGPFGAAGAEQSFAGSCLLFD